jgi:hypothetical protein
MQILSGSSRTSKRWLQLHRRRRLSLLGRSARRFWILSR